MAQAKPACGSHPHDCNANVLSIQYNTIGGVLVAYWWRIGGVLSGVLGDVLVAY